MQLNKDSPKTLSQYVDLLQSQGRYTFTQEEALATLEISRHAFHQAKLLLERKNRLLSPKSKFYVIVPLEYRNSGIIPANRYIDDLMKFLKQPYYVGLLTAASYHEASHQAAQEFQVIAPKPLKPIESGGLRIRFFFKNDIKSTPTERAKSDISYFLVSTPEATAFDLVRYYKGVGYFSHVLTVLAELSEKLDPVKLLKVAKLKQTELSLSQRLGFMLDSVNAKSLTKDLHQWVKKQKPFPALLAPGVSRKGAPIIEKWNLIANEKLESDI